MLGSVVSRHRDLGMQALQDGTGATKRELEREVRTMARVMGHESITRVIGRVELAGGRTALVMELAGPNLRQVTEERCVCVPPKLAVQSPLVIVQHL